MGAYGKILERLEEDQGGPSGRVTVTAPAELPLEPNREPPQPSQSAPETALGSSDLLDDLRTLAPALQGPTVVLAGVSRYESVRPLSSALVAQGRRRGLDVTLAELVAANGNLAIRELLRSAPRAVGSEARLGRLGDEPDGSGEHPGAIGLADWLATPRPRHHLVVIEGAPLALSVDAALAACHFDGLILLVEAGKTPSMELQRAAERARAAGCKMVGIVLTGQRSAVPRWLRRLLAGLAQNP